MLSDLRCRVGKLLWPRVEGFSKLRECPKCMLGGIRSFASAGVSPLRLSRAPELLAPDKALLYAHSAACTITRMEADEDLETPMFREVHARLAQGAAQAYNAARAWIARRAGGRYLFQWSNGSDQSHL